MISVFRSGPVPQPRVHDIFHLQFRVPPSGPPRPEPPEGPGDDVRARRAPALVFGGVLGLALAALVTVAVAAPAVDPEPEEQPTVITAPLPQKLRHAVLLDPKVSEATARACQMAHRLGLARISLAAYDPSRYGVIMGEVRRVAKNTTQPENAMPFYETIIAIPKVAFTKSPDTPVITAGMPLQVDILGGKRTIMNYIMTPIQKSLQTAFREK